MWCSICLLVGLVSAGSVDDDVSMLQIQSAMHTQETSLDSLYKATVDCSQMNTGIVRSIADVFHDMSLTIMGRPMKNAASAVTQLFDQFTPFVTDGAGNVLKLSATVEETSALCAPVDPSAENIHAVAAQVHDQTSQLGTVLIQFVNWATKRHEALANLGGVICTPIATFFRDYIDIIGELDAALIATAKANEGVLELIENSRQASLAELDVDSSMEILTRANGECSAEQRALLAYATKVDRHFLAISEECDGFLAQWSGLSKAAHQGERVFSDIMNNRTKPKCKDGK